MFIKFEHNGKHVIIDVFDSASSVLAMTVTVSDEPLSDDPEIMTYQETDCVTDIFFKRNDDGKVDVDFA